MICQACGTSNAAGRKFCLECGARLATGCPSCGAPNEDHARFCGECGTALADVAATPSAQPATAAPAAVERVAPAAERRIVTVLFADLVGFTTLSEDRDPEAVRDLLTRYFDRARETIERYGGTVEKFIGDAVMAVWGAPTAHEDDAERGVRAALDLVDTVRILGTELGMPDLALRAGVRTGEAAVTVGAQGQGMVAGDLVNTASRLQSVAEPGTVLVGESTQRAALGAIVFEPAGERELKGRAMPEVAFKALRVVAKRGGAGRSEGLEPPFVGRDDELRLLKELFHRTASERKARLVSVTGQGGIGKSRLAWEFLKYIDGLAEDVYWHQGRTPAFGEGLTFWALSEMVRRRAALLETDDEPTTRARLAESLDELMRGAPERAAVERSLLVLLGLEEPPGGGRDELFAAWRTFFEHVARAGPTVLLFEDLHWADAALLDFIDHVLEWSSDHPIYVVTLARPELLERRPDWGAGQRRFLALALDPLPEPAMRQLLDGLTVALPESAVEAILERAGGVPLYAVETVRMLVSEGRLVPQPDGRYRATGDLTRLAVPESLHALIAARLDALPLEDRVLVQDGAVLGQTFTPAALAAVADLSGEALERRLRPLVRAELLTLDTDPLSPERGQYGFTQALIREVAYGMLSHPERRARHLAAARYFESLEDDEIAGALAGHYLAAYRASPEGAEGEALRVQARLALRGAAERATRVGAWGQAVGYLREAVDITPDEDERAALEERLGQALSAAGQYREAIVIIERLRDRARAAADDVVEARHAAELVRTLIHGRWLDEAAATAEDVLGRQPEILDVPELVDLGGQLARAHLLRNDMERSIALSDRVLTAAERLELTAVIADVLITKGVAFTTIGRTREGIALMRAGRAIASAEGLSLTAVRADTNLVVGEMYIDPLATLLAVERGYAEAARIGDVGSMVIMAINGGEVAIAAGRWSVARERAESLLAKPIEAGDRAIMLGLMVQLRALVGEPTHDMMSDLRSRIEADPGLDPMVLPNVELALDEVAGEYRAMYERAQHIAPIDVLNGPSVWLRAGHAALRLRDLDRARTALEGLMASGFRGPVVSAWRDTVAGGIALLEGDRAGGVDRLRESVRRLDDVGLVFDGARTALTAAALLGAQDPDGASFASRARATFQELGAEPLLGQLDELTDADRRPTGIPVRVAG